MTCPNINHPDWKALVELIGLERAYLEYLRHGETIPIIDKSNPFQFSELSLTSESKSDLLLPGFVSFYQQSEAVNTISDSVLNYFKANPKRVEDGKVIPSTFNQAMNNFKAELAEVIKDNPDIDNYKTIQDNINGLRSLVKNKLEVLGLISPTKYTGININQKPINKDEANETKIDGVEDTSDIDINYWKDDWAFEYDYKGNALKQVKQFLAFIPKTEYNKETKEYIQVNNFLSFVDKDGGVVNIPSYMSYDEVFEQLRAVLSDTDNTWDAMSKELEQYQEAKPWIYNLLYQLQPENYDGDLAQLRKQFVSVMSGSYSNSKTVIWKEKNGFFDFKVIDTDQSSVEKTIIATWSNKFRTSKLVHLNQENDLERDKEKVDALIAKINAIRDSKEYTKLKGVLSEIGIDISNETLDTLIKERINNNTIEQQFVSKTGLFSLIEARLKGADSKTEGQELQDDDDKTDINNPLINNSAIKALARIEAKNADYVYSNTYRNGEGNLVYSYTFNKALTRKYKRLVNDEAFLRRLLNISFNKPIFSKNKPIYRNWLYEISTNPSFRTIFSAYPFDTIRQSRPGTNGVRLTKMSDIDLEMTQVALIQNRGARKDGVGRVIRYLLTVPAKTTSYIIQGSGVDIKPFFKDQEYELDKETNNALYTIVASEHNRILSQQARESDIKAYNTGSKLFYFFPAFNKETSPELYNIDGTIKLPTTVLQDGRTVETYIREKLTVIIKQDVNDKILNWKELGLVKEDKLHLVDSDYLVKAVLPKTGANKINQITYAALDYIVNSTLAKFNTHQMFIGDPALYYKTSVNETWNNVEKRLASLIAPAKDLALDSLDEKFISIKLVDREKGNNALNYAQLLQRLGEEYATPYKDIDGTDAQEYTTLKEDLYVKYSLGLIPTKTYNDILKKIDEQGDNLILTKDELGFVFGASKPVYSDTIIYDDEDVAAEEYIKSSSIPLLPQFTKGLEIDKLRKAMEKAEDNKGLHVRAVFNSGTKVGGKRSVNIWNEDGTIKDNLDLEGYGVTLNRSGFGIQQEIPYDENKDEVVKATQVTKLLFDAVLGVDGFTYNGNQITGEDLNNIYVDLHKQLYESGLVKLNNKLLTDGLLDIRKLQKILYEEGLNRGYTPAELSFLEINEMTGKFNIPFWANPSSSKLESLITSLYTNNILKQKMHGRSFVLVSEEGIKGKSEGIVYVSNGRIKLVDKNLVEDILPTDKEKEIVNVSSIDPDTGEEILEEQEAAKAVKEAKNQYKKLDSLLLCLSK